MLKENKIDGASLMANGEAFEDAVRQCKDFQFFNIGIHLNLVEQMSVIWGKPMLKNHRIFFIKYLLGLIGKDFIKRELEAQIQKVVQAGIKPVFINGNQHLHLLPGIMNIVIRLAIKYGVNYIRIVNEPVSLGKGKFFRQLQLLFLNFLSKFAKKKIKKSGLKCNDYFIGFVNAGNLSEDDIKQAWELMENGHDKVVEVGCHPGYEDENLRRQYRHWGDYNWQKELNILKQ